jgi:hypothetical protein
MIIKNNKNSKLTKQQIDTMILQDIERIQNNILQSIGISVIIKQMNSLLGFSILQYWTIIRCIMNNMLY